MHDMSVKLKALEEQDKVALAFMSIELEELRKHIQEALTLPKLWIISKFWSSHSRNIFENQYMY